MKTKAQALKWIGNSEGKQYNFDNYAGFQCYDYANAYFNYVTGKRLSGLFAKNIPFDNKAVLEEFATIYKNYDSFMPQIGDIVVWHGGYGGGAGHVAIVTKATLTQFQVLEQNWLGKGWTDGVNQPGWGPERVTRRWHYYDNPMYFIRFNFPKSNSVKTKVKEAIKPKAKPKAKSKKIMLVAGHGYADPGAVGNGTNERDFIRKNITPIIAKHLRDAGHEVALYGGTKQSQDMYQDTAYGVRVGNKRDYGLYWVNKQKYDVVVEIHLDAASSSASGGHVIINNRYPADSIDKSMQSVIKNNVGEIRGITKRNDLLNVNVSGDININYRLAELGFITNTKDMNWIKKNHKLYSKLLAGAIHGKPIGGTPGGKQSAKPVNKNDKKPNVPQGYKLNDKNVPYKKEKGTYTVTTVKGNNIRSGHSKKNKIVAVLPNGQSVNYDSAFIYDGYRWISYIGNSGKRRYIATGEVYKNGNRKNYYGRFS